MDPLQPIRDEHPDIERSWSETRAEFRMQALVSLRKRFETMVLGVASGFSFSPDSVDGLEYTGYRCQVIREPQSGNSSMAEIESNTQAMMKGNMEILGAGMFDTLTLPEPLLKRLSDEARKVELDLAASMPSCIGYDHDGPPLPDNATDNELLAYTESLVQKESK